jgi:hypothetical protein
MGLPLRRAVTLSGAASEASCRSDGWPRPSRSPISPKAWISLFSLAGPKQFSLQTSTCFISKRG